MDAGIASPGCSPTPLVAVPLLHHPHISPGERISALSFDHHPWASSARTVSGARTRKPRSPKAPRCCCSRLQEQWHHLAPLTSWNPQRQTEPLRLSPQQEESGAFGWTWTHAWPGIVITRANRPSLPPHPQLLPAVSCRNRTAALPRPCPRPASPGMDCCSPFLLRERLLPELNFVSSFLLIFSSFSSPYFPPAGPTVVPEWVWAGVCADACRIPTVMCHWATLRSWHSA